MSGLSVVFLGGRQAGCLGLLTVRAAGYEVTTVVAYDPLVRELALRLALPVAASIHEPPLRQLLAAADLLVCVHGREIVPPQWLKLPRLGAINVHPCLSSYRGANPVGRLLRDGQTRASVGAHRMGPVVDEGEVLSEEFLDVSGRRTVEEVYHALYPLYPLVLLSALERAREPHASPVPG